MMNTIKHNKAFTLAEILIVLVIMSLISVLCMRSITDTRLKQEAVVRLQKTYEDINKAVANGIFENGSIEYWDFSLTQTEFFSTYLSTLNVVKREKFTDMWGTKVPKYYELSGNEEKYLFNNPNHIEVLYLANGAQLLINYVGAASRICIPVDINGIKQPNTAGKDIFLMYLYNDGTVRMDGWDKTRNQLINDASYYRFYCNKNGRGFWCGALIQRDGWKISNDYPWK